MALHTATHIDAPQRFFPDRTMIDLVPLNELIGDGVLIHVEEIGQERYIESLKGI